jgi:hypothetical protein
MLINRVAYQQVGKLADIEIEDIGPWFDFS